MREHSHFADARSIAARGAWSLFDRAANAAYSPLPVLSPQSPLRRLAPDLDPKQRRFLDGIRLAFEAIFISYERLVGTLLTLALLPDLAELPQQSLPTAMLDAWSLVDCVDRLRFLLANTPGLKKSVPALRLFEDAAAGIRELRNHSQHLSGDIGEAAIDEFAWGQLAWLCPVAGEHPDASIAYAIAPGALVDAIISLVNPAGRSHLGRIDNIELKAGRGASNLTRVARALPEVVKCVEEFAAKKMEERGLAPGGSDALTRLGPLYEGIALGTAEPLKPGDVLDIRRTRKRSA